MCCVWCWEWPTNLTILSFRFQAKKNIVIIESFISFLPMWEWYFCKVTITFFCRSFLLDVPYFSIPTFTYTHQTVTLSFDIFIKAKTAKAEVSSVTMERPAMFEAFLLSTLANAFILNLCCTSQMWKAIQ